MNPLGNEADGQSETPTRYSVIIPVYRNEGTLPGVLGRLQALADQLNHELEAVFVVDGSPDGSVELLRKELPQAGFPSQLVSLSRNFGSFAAIRQGLEVAHGPYFAIMAADLQEPPELLLEFFRLLAAAPVDVTIGVRKSRSDPRLSSLSAHVFWALYRRVIQKEVPAGGVDVFGCNRVVRDALLNLRESHSSLVGLLFWVGFRRAHVSYERGPRGDGASGWTFRRKVRYLFDSAFAFTDLPITALLSVGVVGVLMSVAVAIVVLIGRLAGSISVPGYTPLILAITFSTSLILFALGIVGSYVWRTFENTKGRPLAIPLSHEAFEGEHD